MYRTFYLSVVLLAFLCLSAMAATRVSILWIGNSLTGSMFCNNGGFEEAEVLANPDSNKTGYSLAHNVVGLGGTSLSKHWALQSGFALLEDPACGYPSAWWATEPIETFDYIVLQSHIQTATVAAESTAMESYCQKALSYGTKPVIFDCWGIPSMCTPMTNALLAIYNRYKSRGALFAPLYEIHNAINAEKPTTFLYGNDAYNHVNAQGAYVSIAVWEYLFTHVNPTSFTLTQCAGDVPDKTYLDGKIEAVLAVYYDLGTPVVHPASRSAFSTTMPHHESEYAYDISGKYIGKIPSRSRMAAISFSEGRVCIVKKANGAGGTVMRGTTRQ
jgi:hypothetical protein